MKKLSNIIDKHSIGLYHDDGVGVLQKLSPPKLAQSKMKIIKISKGSWLSITTILNVTSLDFPHITSWKRTLTSSYKNSNNDPKDTDNDLNYPSQILRQKIL